MHQFFLWIQWSHCGNRMHLLTHCKRASSQMHFKRASCTLKSRRHQWTITNLAFLSKVIERTVAHQTHHYLTMNNLYPKLQAANQQFSEHRNSVTMGPQRYLKSTWWQERGNSSAVGPLCCFWQYRSQNPCCQAMFTIWIHWESSAVVHFVPTRPLPKSHYWKWKIGTQTSILCPSPPRICFGAIVIHFILRPSWRSDQISRPWLHVVCWWLAALHHNEARWETHCHSQPRTVPLWYSDINFLLANKLSCNPKKTEVVHFHFRYSNIVPVTNITIGDYSIPVSDQACNLGFTFDKHLTMCSQINNICCSSSLALRNIGRVRKYLDQANTKCLVRVFIT